MNRGSTLKTFAISALFLYPLISRRNSESIIECGLAELVSDNRLKIDLPYNNKMDCHVELSFSEPKNFLLSIENFKVRVINSSSSTCRS